MINLRNDYSTLGHERVLKALLEHKDNVYLGYGLDSWSKKAEEKIKEILENKKVEVHFLMNGTGANMILLSHILKPYQAVISADTGHIYVHETGAIEGAGHKILTCNNQEGKILPDQVEAICKAHTDEHMVKPKALYISNATETGSVYTLQELKALKKVCIKYDLYFYMDGARLGVALESCQNAIKWSDLCKLFDAFYIGGTKNGALLGEAMVLVNEDFKENFRYHIKNKGGMYAKGFIIGLEFYELFKDGLYMELAKKSLESAKLLKDIMEEFGYYTFYPSSTNQLFYLVGKKEYEVFLENVSFELLGENEEGYLIRFVTSYASKKEEIEKMRRILEKIRR